LPAGRAARTAGFVAGGFSLIGSDGASSSSSTLQSISTLLFGWRNCCWALALGSHSANDTPASSNAARALFRREPEPCRRLVRRVCIVRRKINHSSYMNN